MGKERKKTGEIYTPMSLVANMLDFGGYKGPIILQQYVIDNSCGNGAFLSQIVLRYIQAYLDSPYGSDKDNLKQELERYIWGIDKCWHAVTQCKYCLDQIAARFEIFDVKWNVICADALTYGCKDIFWQDTIKFHYIFGNPPYIRVHHIDDATRKELRNFKFTRNGMTDVYLAFVERGFQILAPAGIMCLITPRSWLTSKAGEDMRKFVIDNGHLTGIVDMEHYQPFDGVKCYTAISLFVGPAMKVTSFWCCKYNPALPNSIVYHNHIQYNQAVIDDKIYLGDSKTLNVLKQIKCGEYPRTVQVKNGFQTSFDSIFISSFPFVKGTIQVMKSTTGKSLRCIYPYDALGKPLSEGEFKRQYPEAYDYLLSHKGLLAKRKMPDAEKNWYLFGRSQGIADVFKFKCSINNIIRDTDDLRMHPLKKGTGVYNGLYILLPCSYDGKVCDNLNYGSKVYDILHTNEFLRYVIALGEHKNGGYYAFSAKDLENFLNYKLSTDTKI